MRALQLLLSSVVAVAVALTAPVARADSGSWATAQATDLTDRARADVARGDVAQATRRYLEAIRFDATYGPAYLALGGLYESTGAQKDAERAYAMGIEHVAGFADAHVARARLLVRARRWEDAVLDLEAASADRPDDLGILRELARAYNAVEARPAALAAARRMETTAERLGDAPARAEARALGRALALLVGEADPVAAGARSDHRVRRAIAAYARR